MPPVFGPSSPSKARLWSWALPRRRRSSPWARTKRLASSPAMQLLDHDPGAGAFGEDRVERRLGVGEGRGDGHALAGGEAVGLDDDGGAFGRHEGAGGLRGR